MGERCCVVTFAKRENPQCTRRARWWLNCLGFCEQHAKIIAADDPYAPYPDMIDPVTGEIAHGGRTIARYAAHCEWSTVRTEPQP